MFARLVNKIINTAARAKWHSLKLKAENVKLEHTHIHTRCLLRRRRIKTAEYSHCSHESSARQTDMLLSELLNTYNLLYSQSNVCVRVCLCPLCVI